jgi:hypothetical protein
VPAGPIGKIEPPQLSPVLGALIQITANDIKELTTSDDAAAEVKSNVSAEAMDLAATRIDDKAFTYLDNMRQSWARAGEIWLSMAREVYVEEGREVETMDAATARRRASPSWPSPTPTSAATSRFATTSPRASTRSSPT